MTEHVSSQFLLDGSAEQVELLVILAICRNQRTEQRVDSLCVKPNEVLQRQNVQFSLPF